MEIVKDILHRILVMFYDDIDYVIMSVVMEQEIIKQSEVVDLLKLPKDFVEGHIRSFVNQQYLNTIEVNGSEYVYIHYSRLIDNIHARLRALEEEVLNPKPIEEGKEYRCPVCGMFYSKNYYYLNRQSDGRLYCKSCEKGLLQKVVPFQDDELKGVLSEQVKPLKELLGKLASQYTFMRENFYSLECVITNENYERQGHETGGGSSANAKRRKAKGGSGLSGSLSSFRLGARSLEVRVRTFEETDKNSGSLGLISLVDEEIRHTRNLPRWFLSEEEYRQRQELFASKKDDDDDGKNMGKILKLTGAKDLKELDEILSKNDKVKRVVNFGIFHEKDVDKFEILQLLKLDKIREEYEDCLRLVKQEDGE